MCKLAIAIIEHELKYEVDRCQRYLNKVEMDKKKIFSYKNIFQLQTIEEEYVAFWDVYDKWEPQKIEVCMSRIAESDADIIVHSYIQHVGLKGIIYKIPDSKQADMTQILYQGLPGISAMVFRREWLLDFLSCQKDIEIGSEKFYHLLFSMFTSGQCSIELIALTLSEHWSYYGNKTPSVKRARDNMLRYWSAMDIEARNRMLPMCYENYMSNYSEFPMTDFFEGVSMNKNELVEVLRVREEKLTQQIQEANSVTDRKNDFYIFMRNWVELHQSGRSIADRLIQEGITNVAIYGAGKHGRMLYNELNATAVKVAYWIDKSCKGEMIEGCPVVGVDSELPSVDAIIVTPYRELLSIERLLSEKTKAKMLPLDILVRR
ncbi:MAG: hypothetical protein HFI62_13315 [Lachnospiraceae bacterium]|jgi:hypothetical protein|nr:hypothetical protein [Lachnospiraceae bacterium]